MYTSTSTVTSALTSPFSVDAAWNLVTSLGWSLEYTWLWLDSVSNFAIKMNVYFPSSNPWNDRVLFQIDNYRLYLTDNWNIKFHNGTWNRYYGLFDYNTYAWFQNIIAIKQWNNYTLKIWWTTLWNFTNTNTISSTAPLYIWSNSNNDNQLNNIIDYVKIYK